MRVLIFGWRGQAGGRKVGSNRTALDREFFYFGAKNRMDTVRRSGEASLIWQTGAIVLSPGSRHLSESIITSQTQYVVVDHGANHYR
jgi:hypothetical protein